MGKRIPSGLDDGGGKRKKKKREAKSQGHGEAAGQPSEGEDPNRDPDASHPVASTTTAAPTPADASSRLKILPNERLSEFSLRVDQSLPLNSVPKYRTRDTHAIPGVKMKQPVLTRHNKRLARMQAEWRATDAKIKARRAEEDEEAADQREEDVLLWLGAGVDRDRVGKGGKGKRKKKKKERLGNEDHGDDVDPWKQLERKRREQGLLAQQRNLQDVVLAPPVLPGVKSIFKERQERTRHGES